MFRILWILPIAWWLMAAGWAAGCGDDCKGLCGSECDLLDCSYDRIWCQRFQPGSASDALVIHYKRSVDEVDRWTAKISIDLVGIEPVKGYLFEGDEFLERVILSRPDEDEQWPEYDGKDCQITEGGDQAGVQTAGQCNFAFHNGHYLTADFSCVPEAI